MNTDGEAAARKAIASIGLEVRVLPPPHGQVPCTDGQWRAILHDCGIADQWTELLERDDELTRLIAGPPSKVGARARELALKMTDLAVALVLDVEGVGWFRQPETTDVGRDELRTLTDAARDLVRDLPRAAGRPDPRAGGALIVGRIKHEIVRPSTETAAQLAAKTFGVSVEFLEGLHGIDASARLRLESGLDAAALDALSQRALGHLIEEGSAYPPSATGVLVQMLALERPWAAHIVALHTRELVLQAPVAAAAAALEEHRGRMPENWATHVRYTDGLRYAREKADDAERSAYKEGELYQLVAEGPLRRLGWTLLRLLGADPGPLPMLNEVRERCAKAGADCVPARLISQCIVPEWRNEVAHCSVSFDRATGWLRMDTETVDSAALRGARLAVQGILAGFECGVALARAASSPLRDALSVDARLDTHHLIAMSRLADLLAANGLASDSLTVDGTRVQIVLPDGTAWDAANVIVPLALASRQYVLTGLTIQFGDRAPLVLDAEVLEVTRALVLGAGPAGAPPEVLWPAVAVGLVSRGDAPGAVQACMTGWAAGIARSALAAAAGADEGGAGRDPAEQLRSLAAALDAARALVPGGPSVAHADLPGCLRAAGNGDQTGLRALLELIPDRGAPTLPWFAALSGRRSEVGVVG